MQLQLKLSGALKRPKNAPEYIIKYFIYVHVFKYTVLFCLLFWKKFTLLLASKKKSCIKLIKSYSTGFYILT